MLLNVKDLFDYSLESYIKNEKNNKQDVLIE
jgi:hypothetical protein